MTQNDRLLLEERQKLIHLADCSEQGGSVVDEYTADDLADDSNDEHRIEKAERVAERKAGKQRKERCSQAGQAKFRGAQLQGCNNRLGLCQLQQPHSPRQNDRWYQQRQDLLGHATFVER